MAHTVNYAERWQPNIIDIIIQQTLSAAFITTNVDWVSAKTFHFTQMAVGGFKSHARSGGWNRQYITQTDVPYTVVHDRDVEFLMDKADVDESGGTASVGMVTETFVRTQQAPETDAYFFSKVAQEAETAGLYVADAIAGFTTANVYSKLKTGLSAGKIKLYRQRGSVIAFVNSTVMDLLEQSDDFTRKIEVTNVSGQGSSIETRVTHIDSVPIVEVIDDERFYTAFNFTDSFVPAVGGFKINFLIASLETVKTVPKISSIYNKAPGAHDQGDGWLYQNRAFWDTFVFPNGKDNAIDSVYSSRDTVAVV